MPGRFQALGAANTGFAARRGKFSPARGMCVPRDAAPSADRNHRPDLARDP